LHPTEPGGLYVAGTRYKSDDFQPYLYKTTDYGKSWTKITDGIAEDHFTRVIRADPGRPGLLYAGTESGLYVSFDDGANWKSFQLNLPIVPITDLTIKDDDLVVATQGRSFWVLDDLTSLHQLSDAVASSDFHLFTPRPTYRMRGSSARGVAGRGQNPANGVVFRYVLNNVTDSTDVTLRVLETNGDIIQTFTTGGNNGLATEAGMNTHEWNMRYEGAETFSGLILWGGGTQGPRAVPGTYQARLIVDDDSTTVPFEIKQDPRSSSTQADLQAQFDFLVSVRDKLTETHQAIKQIRDVREQVNTIMDRTEDHDGNEVISEAGKAMLDDMKAIEEALYQTKNQSGQDPLNFPIRLNNRLSGVVGVVSNGDFRPTNQSIGVRDEISALIDVELAKLKTILDTDLPAFNRLVREQAVPAVIIDRESEATASGN